MAPRIHLPDETLARLRTTSDDGTLSASIHRTVSRYTELIRRTQQALAGRFTPAEMDALRDVANGWLADPAATIPGGLAAEWEDALPEIGEAHEVDGAAVLARLQALTPAEDFALVEAIERHWREVAAGR